MRSFPADDPFQSTLVQPNELRDVLDKQLALQRPTTSRVVALSAAWFLPNDPEGRTGHAAFEKRRIPRSQFFDLDKICDTSSPWPHMLPSPADFAKCMGLLGLRRSDCVVLYDSEELGLFSAPRAAWTLNHFGHPRVHVLNNFRRWVQLGYPTESGDDVPADIADYELPDNHGNGSSASMEEVQDIIKSNLDGVASPTTIIDARSHGRWSGESPEPRKGIPSGHMPTSINLPYTEVLDPETKALLPPDRLRHLFTDQLKLQSGNVISSCGTGVSAAVVDLALETAGYPEAGERRIYDGSWTEWASRLKSEDGWIKTA